jgi:hypothetical protein
MRLQARATAAGDWLPADVVPVLGRCPKRRKSEPADGRIDDRFDRIIVSAQTGLDRV